MLTKTEIDAMSVDERAKLAEMLWDSMPIGDEIEADIPDWHAEILETRMKDFLAHPDDVIPWEEAHAELKNLKTHA